ncbi:hypothetical protein PPERSA_06175 [Pseudocohnilembus persalinus]|uniref:Transmembrane protein n=1 Tax=Pseudocohnilembus persalinus TaxID=266149 RepID=A0A0V0R0X4_PSEPJ|nr:hypothetical protein PPERSA_06175 [Pseudocohnilembus persalinus]|eukprot:KRX07997.1 hypothetical protein PPERSA_06175 [Pseudocohnilembus persalinus]
MKKILILLGILIFVLKGQELNQQLQELQQTNVQTYIQSAHQQLILSLQNGYSVKIFIKQNNQEKYQVNAQFYDEDYVLFNNPAIFTLSSGIITNFSACITHDGNVIFVLLSYKQNDENEIMGVFIGKDGTITTSVNLDFQLSSTQLTGLSIVQSFDYFPRCVYSEIEGYIYISYLYKALDNDNNLHLFRTQNFKISSSDSLNDINKINYLNVEEREFTNGLIDDFQIEIGHNQNNQLFFYMLINYSLNYESQDTDTDTDGDIDIEYNKKILLYQYNFATGGSQYKVLLNEVEQLSNQKEFVGLDYYQQDNINYLAVMIQTSVESYQDSKQIQFRIYKIGNIQTVQQEYFVPVSDQYSSNDVIYLRFPAFQMLNGIGYLFYNVLYEPLYKNQNEQLETGGNYYLMSFYPTNSTVFAKKLIKSIQSDFTPIQNSISLNNIQNSKGQVQIAFVIENSSQISQFFQSSYQINYPQNCDYYEWSDQSCSSCENNSSIYDYCVKNGFIVEEQDEDEGGQNLNNGDEDQDVVGASEEDDNDTLLIILLVVFGIFIIVIIVLLIYCCRKLKNSKQQLEKTQQIQEEQCQDKYNKQEQLNYLKKQQQQFEVFAPSGNIQVEEKNTNRSSSDVKAVASNNQEQVIIEQQPQRHQNNIQSNNQDINDQEQVQKIKQIKQLQELKEEQNKQEMAQQQKILELEIEAQNQKIKETEKIIESQRKSLYKSQKSVQTVNKSEIAIQTSDNLEDNIKKSQQQDIYHSRVSYGYENLYKTNYYNDNTNNNIVKPVNQTQFAVDSSNYQNLIKSQMVWKSNEERNPRLYQSNIKNVKMNSIQMLRNNPYISSDIHQKQIASCRSQNYLDTNLNQTTKNYDTYQNFNQKQSQIPQRFQLGYSRTQYTQKNNPYLF